METLSGARPVHVIRQKSTMDVTMTFFKKFFSSNKHIKNSDTPSMDEVEKLINDRINQMRPYLMPDGFKELQVKTFYNRTGKLPNEHLTKFTDKIIWSMIFNPTPLKKKCADKLLVRDYVADKIGKQYLTHILAQWDNPSEIDFTNLPVSFALKLSNGSGSNLIVHDKNSLDMNQIKDTCRKWLISNFSSSFLEMQYYRVPKLVFAEEFLDMQKYEYQMFVFHGKVKLIRTMTHKYDDDHHGTKFFDTQWHEQPFYSSKYKLTHDVPRPAQLDKLIELTQKLCADFDFVRCDWIILKNGDIKLSELTFSPAAGINTFKPESDAEAVDEMLGQYLHIPQRDINGQPID